MLSILILSYQYDLYALVEKLYSECSLLEIEFEIICSDDASENHYNNSSINQWPYCSYLIQPVNIGRSASRNFLITQARYDTIIMLDSDTFPVNNGYIAKYLRLASDDTEAIISGGLQYQQKKPDKSELLRWVYGKSREAIAANIRQQKPYDYTLCSNICFNKKKLGNITFPKAVSGYGYEDFVFFKQLELIKRRIIHVDNEVYHLKLETSSDFLTKTTLGIQTLQQLINGGVLEKNATSLSRTQCKIQKIGLQKIGNFLFEKTEAVLVKNLTSSRPKLVLFDLYKLGKLNQIILKH